MTRRGNLFRVKALFVYFRGHFKTTKGWEHSKVGRKGRGIGIQWSWDQGHTELA